MSRVALVPPAILFLLLVAGSARAADGRASAGFLTLGGVRPRGSLALLFSTDRDHAFQFGPRVAISQIHSGQDDRYPLSWGGEAELWFLNAFAPGIGLEWTTSDSPRVQAEAFLAVRVLRSGQSGAWAGRIGPFYRQGEGWGMHFAVTLQLSGVRSIGEGNGSL